MNIDMNDNKILPIDEVGIDAAEELSNGKGEE